MIVRDFEYECEFITQFICNKISSDGSISETAEAKSALCLLNIDQDGAYGFDVICFVDKDGNELVVLDREMHEEMLAEVDVLVLGKVQDMIWRSGE